MLIKRARVWITAFLVAWIVAAAPALSQTLQDVPPEGVGPGARAASTLDLASRAKIKEAIRKRDYTRAEELLVDAIRTRPQSPELLTFLGGVFFLDGKYLNSAVAMKKAEALKDLDDGSRFTLAMAYVKLDHRDWARPESSKNWRFQTPATHFMLTGFRALTTTPCTIPNALPRLRKLFSWTPVL